VRGTRLGARRPSTAGAGGSRPSAWHCRGVGLRERERGRRERAEWERGERKGEEQGKGEPGGASRAKEEEGKFSPLAAARGGPRGRGLGLGAR
jgi:hypothetical protein